MRTGSGPVPEARGFGRGWHSLLGGLVDTAAVGRTPPGHTKLPFSEDPLSPGLALVGGADSTGMCRNVPSQERGVGGRLCQVPDPHCPAYRLRAASSRKLARALPAPQLRSCGPSQAAASAASARCAPEKGAGGLWKERGTQLGAHPEPPARQACLLLCKTEQHPCSPGQSEDLRRHLEQQGEECGLRSREAAAWPGRS